MQQVPLFDLARSAGPKEPTSFKVIRITGDGKCLFRALAKGMALNQVSEQPSGFRPSNALSGSSPTLYWAVDVHTPAAALPSAGAVPGHWRRAAGGGPATAGGGRGAVPHGRAAEPVPAGGRLRGAFPHPGLPALGCVGALSRAAGIPRRLALAAARASSHDNLCTGSPPAL